MRAPASLVRFSGPDAAKEPPTLTRGSVSDPPIYVARIPDGWAWAHDVRDLWDTGLVPKRWDRAGIAGRLWRGSPVLARLPAAGIQAIPPNEAWRLTPDGPVVSREPTEGVIPTTPRDVRERLEAWIRASGATVGLDSKSASSSALRRIARDAGLRLETSRKDASFDERLLHRMREGWEDGSPSVTSLLRASPGPVLSGAGGGALFGAHPMFAEWSRRRSPARARLGRPRPGGDPMDVDRQRRLELRVFRDIPVNWAHSYVAAVPAATRDAISTVGPRPADGLMPAGRGVEVVSDVVWDRVADRAAALREAGILCPFLDEDVVRAVRGLPARIRFGRPGSGGLLARWAGGTTPIDDAGGALEALARAELHGPLAKVLSPDAIAEQGIFRPEAVERALEAWRGGKNGWTSSRVFVLADVTTWVAHHGLTPSGD